MAHYVKRFEETDQYEQQGGVFHEILRRGLLADISMGWVRMTGPAKSAVGKHDKWEQAYLVFRGSGTLHLGNETFHLTDRMLAVIPRQVTHWIELAEGEEIEYVYINRYLERLSSE
jgi:mannose-6-phosphate isomerase-like protein (cupin superfamily)